MPARAWTIHLPAGVSAEGLDLGARVSLPAAWAAAWARSRAAPTLFDQRHGWVTAGRARSGDAAGGRAAAGGGSRARRPDAVQRRVLARAGDRACRRAAVRDRRGPDQHRLSGAGGRAHRGRRPSPSGAAWTTRSGRAGFAPPLERTTLIIGPEVDLPDGGRPGARCGGAGGAGVDRLHVRHDRSPKGAVLSHANLLAGSESVALAWRWTRDATGSCWPCPLFHAHGLCVGLHGTLLAGASAVLLPRFDVDAVLDAAAEHDASMFFGVPTMYHRLAKSPRVGELARLRLCVSGSAPLPAELHRALAERGGQRVLERYGMTETLMLVSNPYDGERRPGSVGFPLPGVELRFSDGDEERSRSAGRTCSRATGSARRPPPRASPTGGFAPAISGSLDPDGYLRILGRSKELIISGGLNVYPREVEEVLLAHPGVAEVAVVGTPSEEWGEIVTAFVVPPRIGPPRSRCWSSPPGNWRRSSARAASTSWTACPATRSARCSSTSSHAERGAAGRLDRLAPVPPTAPVLRAPRWSTRRRPPPGW